MPVVKLNEEYVVMKPFGAFAIGDSVYPRTTRIKPLVGSSEVLVYHNGTQEFYPFELDKCRLVVTDYLTACDQPIVFTEDGMFAQDDLVSFLSGIIGHDWAFDWGRCEEFEHRVKTQFFKRWLCTDTYVGYGRIVIDGFAVAMFAKTARKNDCFFGIPCEQALNDIVALLREFDEDEPINIDDYLTSNFAGYMVKEN